LPGVITDCTGSRGGAKSFTCFNLVEMSL
jgi:hypothetical protein